MGKDPEYTVPVERVPYYAIKIYPVIMGTFGGVKTTKQFEVLTDGGQVIKNLFATGETANKVIYNHVYMSGSSVQFALTSGRIAGEVAAKQL
ncbi:fumarate reductase [Secundilactobacillus paracollinoides]|uniref:Fumarate reductase n=1 Tax=Secundilactobacillus paracollinoides TaxID=240427 RepID=A0A1B2J247_9LACO|nr:fumarate reductase [Secundilactobacillus paracollinoides]ANZ65476.1 fumarate reductase [Secundilactobacillus paracollinoides]ANZ68381.1 fumarate reductase [Secundilactobacillus paracollinoides]